jgi:hypothetical protein
MIVDIILFNLVYYEKEFEQERERERERESELN